MASKGKLKGLTVEIGGDTTKLDKALESVNKKSASLSGELGEVNRLLRFDPGNADLLAQKQDILAAAISNAKEKLDTLKQAEQQVQEQFERGEVSEKQVRELGREITATEQKIKQYENAVVETTQAMTGLSEGSEQAEQSGKSLRDTISDQSSRLTELKKKYVDIATSQGESSQEAADLAGEIETLSGELAENKKKLSEAEKTANSYDKTLANISDASQETEQSSKSLRDTISDQGSKLDELKKKYADVATSQGKNSAEAQALAQEIKELSGELAGNKKKLSEAERSADEYDQTLDDVSDASKDAEKNTGNLGAALANAAKVGFTAIAAAATAAITGLVAAAESTREYRTAMGKLETAFTTSGYTTEQATAAYQELQSVLGDSDQAVETANHLAKLTANEEDLATWTGDILPGVFATFGDSLPIEGLTEAANETAKVGQVTGPLADALNWAGVSEDEFNESLAACSTEQERQALITETLAGLYTEAADAYKTTNAEVIRANEANEAWTASLAGVGGAIEPILTDIKLMGASLVSDLVPGVQTLADSFRALMSGEGSADAVGEAFSGIITSLLTKVTELAPTLVQVGISLISTLVTSLISMLPQLVTTGVQLITTILDGLTSAIPQLTAAVVTMIPQLVQALVTGIPQLIQGGVQLLLSLLQAIPQVIPSLVAGLPQLVLSIIDGLLSAIPQLIEGALQFLLAIVDAIPLLVSELIPAIPQIITTVITGLLDAVPQLLEASVTLLLAIVEAIPQIVVELIKALPQIWETMKNYLSQLPGKLWAILVSMVQNFARWGTESRQKALEGAKNILSSVVDTIKSLPGKILSFLAESITNLATWGVDMQTKAREGMRNVVSSVVNTLKDLPSKVTSIGGDLISGLWNGINDKFSWLKNKISGFASSVLSSIKNFFGVHSPSTETAWIGEMLDKGLAEGVLDNIANPIKAMERVSGGVLDAAEDEINGLTLSRQLSSTPVATTATVGMETALTTKLDKILAAIEKGQVLMLDGDTLVGATVSRYDNKLGQRRALAARGAM